jgi:transposase
VSFDWCRNLKKARHARPRDYANVAKRINRTFGFEGGIGLVRAVELDCDLDLDLDRKQFIN